MEAFVFISVSICIVGVVSCTLGFLNYVWWKPKTLERILRQQGITGPPYRFLFGNIKESSQSMKEAQSKPMNLSHNQIQRRVNPFLFHTVNKYGTTSVSWLGPYALVNIMDPEMIKEALLDKDGHLGKVNLNPYVKFLVPGLASYDGQKWAHHRRIINPAFHLEKIKMMQSAFVASFSELIRKWESLVGSEGSAEVDVWPEFQNITRDVISRTAFGSNFKEAMQIFILQSEQGELLIKAISESIYIPGSRFLPTRDNKRREEINKEVNARLRGMIERREKDIKMGEGAGNGDLLGLLMESNLNISKEGSEFKGLTTEEVIDECKLFYFAGQETTAVLLTWTLVVLSMHPTWQILAREEVLQVFEKNIPDHDGLHQLKIVTMILYEVLRLYPPVILLYRMTCKATRLGEFLFPPGVLLTMSILLIHRNKELWGNDAEEFKPERFANGISMASKHQVAYFPFGIGPRICIGQNFALVEAKIALAMILQHFSFELSPSYAHAPHLVITLQPQYGAQIILRKL